MNCGLPAQRLCKRLSIMGLRLGLLRSPRHALWWRLRTNGGLRAACAAACTRVAAPVRLTMLALGASRRAVVRAVGHAVCRPPCLRCRDAASRSITLTRLGVCVGLSVSNKIRNEKLQCMIGFLRVKCDPDTWPTLLRGNA